MARTTGYVVYPGGYMKEGLRQAKALAIKIGRDDGGSSFVDRIYDEKRMATYNNGYEVAGRSYNPKSSGLPVGRFNQSKSHPSKEWQSGSLSSMKRVGLMMRA